MAPVAKGGEDCPRCGEQLRPPKTLPGASLVSQFVSVFTALGIVFLPIAVFMWALEMARLHLIGGEFQELLMILAFVWFPLGIFTASRVDQFLIRGRMRHKPGVR